MRAIKIDVEKQEVYALEIEPGLQPLYDAIGCDMIELPVIFCGQHALYVDEEGLLKPHLIKGGFYFEHFLSQPLIGNGIIVNGDDEGNDTDCLLTETEVRKMVKFLDKEFTEYVADKILNS